jgi:sn-1 stearoyl-lipid 9-desaturase
MAFLGHILEVPSYGYERDGALYVPTKKEIFREFFQRMNIFRSRKNWLALFGWTSSMAFGIPFYFFLVDYITWPLFGLGFIYSMIILGTHGTIYYHRYSTHRAYQFSHPFWRFIVRNMVIKIIPEETYVVSHHVHHWISEKPGDPYNVNGGWLYCFLADVIHQPIAKDLSEEDYRRVTGLLNHTGVRMNSYAQYQKWGSICHPVNTILHFALNWAFWYAAFYWMGGHALATAMFGSAGFWAFGVRTFNYDGHGGGKDKRKEGIDFNRDDLSINQLWPGLVTGEWHNNHHLYPNGVRAGFLPYQFDTAWVFIRFYSMIGAVKNYRDYKDDFYKKHYEPYLQQKAAKAAAAAEVSPALS